MVVLSQTFLNHERILNTFDYRMTVNSMLTWKDLNAERSPYAVSPTLKQLYSKTNDNWYDNIRHSTVTCFHTRFLRAYELKPCQNSAFSLLHKRGVYLSWQMWPSGKAIFIWRFMCAFSILRSISVRYWPHLPHFSYWTQHETSINVNLLSFLFFSRSDASSSMISSSALSVTSSPFPFSWHS